MTMTMTMTMSMSIPSAHPPEHSKSVKYLHGMFVGIERGVRLGRGLLACELPEFRPDLAAKEGLKTGSSGSWARVCS
ncbi:hypothetical protein GTR04_6851 [Trichophyton interdigitale]|nr:hypothetical protein GY632_7053 [Trichophyton interdigitale]KAG8205766.1 hypothetical protein GTR04_6851 [Trichophyton interdigitale]